MHKKIQRIDHPRQKHWVGDGFHVSQMIPGYDREMSGETSPFLMLDYNEAMILSPRDDGHRPWVGYHPHRGFETVTIVYSWEVEHADTAWNGGIIWSGEVQWMTAGRGLLHSEFVTERFARSGWVQEFVQLWVDLPKEHKMTSPRYQALTRENIKEVGFEGGLVRVIAWEYEWVKWAAKTFSPIELYDVRFTKGGSLHFSFPPSYTATILVMSGDMETDGKKIEAGSIAFFSRSGDDIIISWSPSAKILIMAGRPLEQSIVSHWPFVMNTKEEIIEAFSDLRAWKMGTIDED